MVFAREIGKMGNRNLFIRANNNCKKILIVMRIEGD